MQHHHGPVPTFDPGLLDALALCFVEAALDELMAEQRIEDLPIVIDPVACCTGDVRAWLATQYPSAS